MNKSLADVGIVVVGAGSYVAGAVLGFKGLFVLILLAVAFIAYNHLNKEN